MWVWTYFLLNPSKKYWFFSFVWVGSKGDSNCKPCLFCRSSNLRLVLPCLADFCGPLPTCMIQDSAAQLSKVCVPIWRPFSLSPSFLRVVPPLSRSCGSLEVCLLFLQKNLSGNFLGEFCILCVWYLLNCSFRLSCKKDSLLYYSFIQALQILSSSNIHLLLFTLWYLQTVLLLYRQCLHIQ